MSEIYTLLTPLPQLKIPDGLPDFVLSHGLSIGAMIPQLRRRLLNAAKEKGQSDDILEISNEGEAIFYAEVQCPVLPGNPFFSALYYSAVAATILKRIFNCIFLFQDDILESYPIPCWFVARGTSAELDNSTLKPLDPHWKKRGLFNENNDPSFGIWLIGLKQYWGKLSQLCHIEQLIEIYSDVNKQKEYIDSGNQNNLNQIADLMGAKSDEESFVVDDKASPADVEAARSIKPGPKWQRQRVFERYTAKYLDEISELDKKLYEHSSERRLQRSFQFFVNAFKLSNPIRYVTFVTALEALFCTQPTRVGSQLRSRIGRFINSDDYANKNKICEKVNNAYVLRSKIIHGSKYNDDEIADNEEYVIELLRTIFLKLLSDEKLFNLFFDGDHHGCNDYLDRLSLGGGLKS